MSTQQKSSESDSSSSELDNPRKFSDPEKNLPNYFETPEWNLLQKYLRGQISRLTLSLSQILTFKNSTTTRMTECEIWLQHEPLHLATWARLALPDYSSMLPPGYHSTLSMELRIRYDGVVETKITLRTSHVMENFALVLQLRQDSDLSLSIRPKSRHELTPGSRVKAISSTSSEPSTVETKAVTLTSGSPESQSSTNPFGKWNPLRGSWEKSPY